MPSKKSKQWLTPQQIAALPVGWPIGVPYTPNSKVKPTLTGSKKKARKRDSNSKNNSKLPREIVNEFSGICNNSKTPQLACRKLEAMNFASYSTIIWQTLITGSFLNIASEVVTDDVDALELSIFNDESENLQDSLYLVTHIVQRHKHMIVTMYDILNTIVHTFCSRNHDQSVRLTSLIVHLRRNLGISISHLVLHLTEQDALVDSGFAIQFVSGVLHNISKSISRQNAIDSLQDSGIKCLIDLVPGPSKTYKKLFEHLKDHNIAFMEKTILLLTKDTILEKVENELYAEFSDFTSAENTIRRARRLFDDYAISKAEQIECIAPHILDTEKTSAIENIRTLAKYLAEICNSADLETHLLNISADGNHKYFLDICYALYDNDVLSEDVIIDWYNSDDAKEDHSEAVQMIEKLITFFDEAETESDSE